MAKFGNAVLRGTVPAYGTVRGGGRDPSRTFEYPKAGTPRKSRLDEAFESRNARHLTTTSEM